VFDLNNADTKQKLKALIKTFISYAGTGLVLSSAMLILWIDIVQLSKYIAPIINLIITVPVNFVVNKVWAFKK
jgi:putative flippase GtrA